MQHKKKADFITTSGECDVNIPAAVDMECIVKHISETGSGWFLKIRRIPNGTIQHSCKTVKIKAVQCPQQDYKLPCKRGYHKYDFFFADSLKFGLARASSVPCSDCEISIKGKGISSNR